MWLIYSQIPLNYTFVVRELRLEVYMGSSGSGRMGDYRKGNIKGTSGTRYGGASGGESSCPKIIENINLEDIATSEFFRNSKNVPTVSANVHVRDEVISGRLVVELKETNEIIGNLPTKYNVLLTCIKSGINYEGSIVSSGLLPIPYVVVSLNAI